jgi:hypothetical protein
MDLAAVTVAKYLSPLGLFTEILESVVCVELNGIPRRLSPYASPTKDSPLKKNGARFGAL